MYYHYKLKEDDKVSFLWNKSRNRNEIVVNNIAQDLATDQLTYFIDIGDCILQAILNIVSKPDTSERMSNYLERIKKDRPWEKRWFVKVDHAGHYYLDNDGSIGGGNLSLVMSLIKTGTPMMNFYHVVMFTGEIDSNRIQVIENFSDLTEKNVPITLSRDIRGDVWLRWR